MHCPFSRALFITRKKEVFPWLYHPVRVDDQEVSYLYQAYSNGSIQSLGSCGKQNEFHVLPFGKGGLAKSYGLQLSDLDLQEKHETQSILNFPFV